MSREIWIVTHGEVGKMTCQVATEFFGGDKRLNYLSFSLDMSLKQLEKEIDQIFNQTDKELIFLVDIYGGTPYNAISLAGFNKSNYHLISGVNLAMLITLITEPNISVRNLIKAGKDSIRGIDEHSTTTS